MESSVDDQIGCSAKHRSWKWNKLIFIATTVWTLILFVVFNTKSDPNSQLFVWSHDDPSDSWTDDWRAVTSQVSVYSAFLDTRRNRNVVKVLSIGPSKASHYGGYRCVIEDSNELTLLNTTYQVIEEAHNKPKSPMFFLCQLDGRKAPHKVGIRFINETITWIKVRNASANDVQEGQKIAICVRPIYGGDDLVLRIAEFITVWQYLGASHFIFYDFEMSFHIQRYLATLQNSSSVSLEILPWKLLAKDDSTWCNAQLAFLQDCLYRSMNDYKYVIPVDLDEFIFPSRNKTIIDVLNGVAGNDIGSFVVKHALFCRGNSSEFTFATQSYLLRHSKLGGFRSKSIYQSRLVDRIGIHYSWKQLEKTKRRYISPGQLLLHHYRVALRQYNYSECVVEDDNALRANEALRNSDVIKIYWQQRI